MSILSRLFGGAGGKVAEPEIYKDFRIFPEPVKEAGGYRLVARIESGAGDALRSHRMIRADTFQSAEAAADAAIAKARLLIDQRGEQLFG